MGIEEEFSSVGRRSSEQLNPPLHSQDKTSQSRILEEWRHLGGPNAGGGPLLALASYFVFFDVDAFTF